MLLPIRKRNGLIHQTIICDVCRKRINEQDFPSATVDFSPIDQDRLQHATAEQLQAAALQRHFHADCCPTQSTAAAWQKLHRVVYSMVINVFNAKNSTVAAAAKRIREAQGPDTSFLRF
jgi:hypothetical protein